MTVNQQVAPTQWKLKVDAINAQFEAPAIRLGPWTSYGLMHDPKHLCFVLSRYKFCAKMLEGKERVLEVGCGDGFGIPIMAQAVKHLHCTDWEERIIADIPQRLSHLKNVTYEALDVTVSQPRGTYDAVLSVDVIEHIESEREEGFMRHLCGTLDPGGVLIIGTPNKTSAVYASPQSNAQHINLKTASDLRSLMNRYCLNTFLFSMNDEVLHTGYAPMAHYLFAIGAGIRPLSH